MIGKLWLAFCVLALLIVLGPAAPTHAVEPTQILIYNAWSRPMEVTASTDATEEPMNMDGMSNSGVIGVAYMNIENTSDTDIKLISAQTDAAEVVEIHESTMDGEVMQMRPLTDGLTIPADEMVALETGSYHMMLINLTRNLVEGEGFVVTLSFDVGGDDLLTVPVGVYVTLLGYDPAETIVVNAWGRATAEMLDGMVMNEPAAPSMPTSAAYMVMINRGQDAERLVSVEVDPSIAEAAELHEMNMDGEVMQMRPLTDGLPIDGGSSVVLEPGGYHVMLINLKQELYAGHAIVLTLNFESGLVVHVAVPLQFAGDTTDMGGGMN